MLPAEDLLTCVYVLVDDLITARAIVIPPRPGSAPACRDAELLAIALVRHLLGRRSEAGFLAEVARDWSHLCCLTRRLSGSSRAARQDGPLTRSLYQHGLSADRDVHSAIRANCNRIATQGDANA